ncbi:transglycosylase SLT domain-containing protein [bacterium]|jgi:membrane-bound lytic murein transglycosylase D|nr:transglycosylase SLT domain-containing protein [bacterium]
MNVGGWKKIFIVLQIAMLVGLSTQVEGTPERGLAAHNFQTTQKGTINFDAKDELRTRYLSEGNLFYGEPNASALAIALNDTERRLTDEFEIPPSLRGVVGFWMRIYTEWSTRQAVIFDHKHPEVVYAVLDFRELAQKARNDAAYEIMSGRKISKTMKDFRRAFARLGKYNFKVAQAKFKNPDSAEYQIISAIKNTGHKHPFSFHAQNMKILWGQRDNVIKGLYKAESYFPIMERIFMDLGVPREVTRLSLLESSFENKATSRVGAKGVWQFLDLSGREFLTLNEKAKIDERISPIKSSVAAARLLRRNRQVLGAWSLAITSYNHGLRNLVTIPKRIRTSDKIISIMEPCGKKSPLGFASKSYYVGFLALLHAETYRDLFYGEPPSKKIQSIQLYHVAQPESALSIALKKGISLYDLRLYNPDIQDHKLLLPKKFVLVLPSEVDELDKLTGIKKISKSLPINNVRRFKKQG